MGYIEKLAIFYAIVLIPLWIYLEVVFGTCSPATISVMAFSGFIGEMFAIWLVGMSSTEKEWMEICVVIAMAFWVNAGLYEYTNPATFLSTTNFTYQFLGLGIVAIGFLTYLLGEFAKYYFEDVA